MLPMSSAPTHPLSASFPLPRPIGTRGVVMSPESWSATNREASQLFGQCWSNEWSNWPSRISDLAQEALLSWSLNPAEKLSRRPLYGRVPFLSVRPVPLLGYRAAMRALVQRVTRASVSVDDVCVGQIKTGLCVLVGVTHDDTPAKAIKLADKLFKLRIFSDGEGKMNLSVADVGGDVLVISQFTLYGNARKGNRPAYVEAARPEVAEPLVDLVVSELRAKGLAAPTGVFGADMDVDILNQGPVTLSIEL